VAAGVYLLLRLYPVFVAAPGALEIVFWVGSATALFCALVATGEMNLKRVLAWSTSSHLGEMMLAIGLGGPLAAALQFLTHASSKSTLFLAAGMVDKHAGTQDLRRLRGLAHVLPLTALSFLMGALSLVGLQSLFLTSADDLIVATALSSGSAAFLMLGLIFLSGVYIARAGIAIFAGDQPKSASGPTERNRPMLIGMLALGVAAALDGLVVTLIPQILPFGMQPQAPWSWRLFVILAAVTGLAFGGWHAWRYHAASPFGWLPGALEGALGIATALPVKIVLGLARGVSRLEHQLDAFALGTANTVWALAVGSDRLERRDFGPAGDRLAHTLQWGGEKLRSLESGKLYLYTLGLFAWSLIVVIAAGLAFGF
jgi:NADH-quinone oxidoreductase subunit L